MVNIKVIIPLAGKGTRLRPHTYSRPKPLVHVAGKPVLGHILDKLKGLDIEEIIFITGDMEDKVKKYVRKNYDYKTKYIPQTELKGDGHAINLAKDDVDSEVLIIFVDTLFVADLQKDIENIKDYEGIVWTNKTDDPRRFGIVNLKDETILDIEEKPEHPKSDQAIIGLYYFKKSKIVFEYLDKIMKQNIDTGGEYRLADAMALMIKDGIKLTSKTVDKWLDCGVPKTLLETNRYLLENGMISQGKSINSIIIEPVFIHEESNVENSVIGPNVSIGKYAEIKGCVIKNTIIDRKAYLKNINLEDSLIGRETTVIEVPKRLNIGDNTQISPKNY